MLEARSTRENCLSVIFAKVDMSKSKSSWWSAKHRKYKYLDKKSGLKYDLTLDQAKALMSLPCFYCCKPESHGLDRISNDLGHELTNVVPCCGTCNLMLASTPWAAKLEMRESLRSIREKGLLGDWKPPYLTEPQVSERKNHDMAVNRFAERAEALRPPPTSIIIANPNLPHRDASDRAIESLQRMSESERAETLINAGILTHKYALAACYAPPSVDVSEFSSQSALWIQCTQCGWGQQITNDEIDCGDFCNRQSCPECGLGPCLIDDLE